MFGVRAFDGLVLCINEEETYIVLKKKKLYSEFVRKSNDSSKILVWVWLDSPPKQIQSLTF